PSSAPWSTANGCTNRKLPTGNSHSASCGLVNVRTYAAVALSATRRLLLVIIIACLACGVREVLDVGACRRWLIKWNYASTDSRCRAPSIGASKVYLEALCSGMEQLSKTPHKAKGTLSGRHIR